MKSRSSQPSLRRYGFAASCRTPRCLIFATPVASAAGLTAIRGRADEVSCLREVADFGMVSDWYEDFSPPSEQEAVRLLQEFQQVADANPKGAEQTKVWHVPGRHGSR